MKDEGMTAIQLNQDVNPYMQGNFRPVQEEVTEFELEVSGDIPKELNGRYLRNGPNPFAEVPNNHHWFIGAGMVHGIRLFDGEAKWYRNRYVGSRELSKFRQQEDITGRNWNNSSGGPNTNVAGFAGKTWAMVEAGGSPVELDYELETIGRNNFDGTLPGAFTAHPKVDPASGEMHAMVYAWPQWLDHVQYVVVATNGQVRKTLDIPLPGMTMMHDMSLTEKYVIIYDQPVIVDMNLLEKSNFPFAWNPDYGNRVGLLPRQGTANDIVWVDVPLGYAFHPMNAFDNDDGSVTIDLCNYEKMFNTDLSGPFGDGLPRLERWNVNPDSRSISINIIDERANEFPRHLHDVGGQPYRYGYSVSISADPADGWQTLKHDLQSGETMVFDHGSGRAGGEAVFVPKQASNEEDAGYLMTFVHDLNNDSAEFVVIDAQNFSRGYVAQVKVPRRIPFGFHGNWVSDESVAPS
tara:strand:- start:3416 stop:4807 length:1392 start_codon:yes stop_codon:yes gene_type:complete